VRDHCPSVDRIDNSRGYTHDNIVIVSFKANRLKSNASIEELQRLANFYGGLDAASIGVRDQRSARDGNAADGMSGVLPAAEEEARPMPVGDVQAGRGGLELLALRAHRWVLL
jgi:hypothetical protein